MSPSLLEHKLIVVTGKGGVGKSTIAMALALLGARAGKRVAVAHAAMAQAATGAASTGAAGAAAASTSAARATAAGTTAAGSAGAQATAGRPAAGQAGKPGPASELLADEGISIVPLDPERDLLAWTRQLGGRLSGRLLASSSTFQYFAAAAPGAKELVSLVKVAELCEGRAPYDLVVLDAPATGHALGMLAAPRTFGAIVRSGPLAEQAALVRDLLDDPSKSAYVAVAHPTEMAVSETLELEQELRRSVGRHVDVVIVNGVVSRRFTRAELERIAAATGACESVSERRRRFGARGQLALAAARAAEAVNRRGRTQDGQVARLRRQRFEGADRAPMVVKVPLQVTPRLDRDALQAIANRLAGGIHSIPSRSSNPSSARQSRRTRTDNSR